MTIYILAVHLENPGDATILKEDEYVSGSSINEMLAEYSARMETVLEWGMDDRKDVYFRSKAALEIADQTLTHEELKPELLDELEAYVEEFEQNYLEEEDPGDDSINGLTWQEGNNNEPPAL